MKATTNRLADDLAQHLRDRVLAGEFVAGARISESGVANEYGVARPTARSAFESLVADGLLVRSAYSALRVIEVSTDDLPQILTLLDFVEGLALEEVVRRASDLRELRRAIDSPLSTAMHALVAASGSERLVWIHRRTTFELIVCLGQHGLDQPELKAEGGALLRSLSEALFRDDAVAARRLLDQIQFARRVRLPVSV